MQTETIDKSQQATPSIDEELIDTLIAISVVAKRLAANLRQQNTENGGKQDEQNESDNFEILLFGVSIDGGEVQVFDLACGDTIPDGILAALSDDTVTKWAFNANFERICLSHWLKKHHPEHFKGYNILEDPASKYLDPASWKCTMIWSAYMGLPLSLEGVGAVLKLQDQKMKEGKDLIKYFCCPCKPTKVNGGRTRNLPEHAPDKWEAFKTYNKRDVEVEMSIKQKLSKFPVPDFVWDEYHLDQEINDRGIMLDMDIVKNAITFDEKSKSELMISMQNITNLDNPNSVVQMKQWLSDNGIEAESLGKKDVAAMIKNTDGDVATALKLRLQLAKSSVKKYQAMQNAVCKDGRAHGMFQFYGANRSGRWAGRLIQLQNLPQNHMNDLADARELVRTGDYDSLELLYDDIPDTLSQLIRTAFIARPGYKFVVSDYSAIEARVLAYLAGETWRSKVFAEGKDIYCASASQMFGVPVEKHGINSHLRQKGKIAELALGYGGSVGALISMGALDMGLTEDELQPLVDEDMATSVADKSKNSGSHLCIFSTIAFTSSFISSFASSICEAIILFLFFISSAVYLFFTETKFPLLPNSIFPFE